MKERLLHIAKTIFRGVGQIMLQENAFTGVLFFIGVLYGSVLMGLMMLFAAGCGTLTAILLKYNKDETARGLYGFSAALVGVALPVFIKHEFLLWFLILTGASTATIIQHFFLKRKIPIFTLPFVGVTWVIIYCIEFYFPNHTIAAATLTSTSNLSTGVIRSYGQVIFQESIVSSIIFFIAVFIQSPLAAFYGAAGALIATLVSENLGAPQQAISMGLFGYNAVLCAITFSGVSSKNIMWAITSVLLSVIISLFLSYHNITQLTFPFVMASFVTISLKNKTSKDHTSE